MKKGKIRLKRYREKRNNEQKNCMRVKQRNDLKRRNKLKGASAEHRKWALTERGGKCCKSRRSKWKLSIMWDSVDKWERLMRTEGNGCNNVVAGLVNEMVDKTEKVSANAKREWRTRRSECYDLFRLHVWRYFKLSRSSRNGWATNKYLRWVFRFCADKWFRNGWVSKNYVRVEFGGFFQQREYWGCTKKSNRKANKKFISTHPRRK
jgi:hypothetical protein